MRKTNSKILKAAAFNQSQWEKALIFNEQIAGEKAQTHTSHNNYI